MRRLAAVALLAACKFSPGTAAPDDGSMTGEPTLRDASPDDAIDSNIDAPPDSQFLDAPSPSAACFGTFEVICLPAPLPANALTINASITIDTDNVGQCDTTATGTTVDACVRAATTITINATVTARGSRPLVLLATTGAINLNMNGIVDVSSHAGQRGAGANPASCTGTPAQNTGGGFGGTFGGVGGNGGTGALGAGGIADPLADIANLRGGCSGGTGGGNANSGGFGGGAVLFIAGSSITVDKLVTAAGAGGQGSAAGAVRGGGGGGSGGLIVFDSTVFTLNGAAKLLAAGGGGGEGSTLTTSGDDGSDPNPDQLGTAAPGGAQGAGGNGGGGGTGGNGGGGGSGGTGGGGGGGGGTGKIKVTASTINDSGSESPGISN